MASFSIFISYRRSDTPDAAGVLYDALASKYGEPNVFMDVELRPGTRYEEVIMQRVRSCDVLIALIGPSWLTASDEEGRRLDHPDDLLRREIVGALERGATVIPVLAGSAEMPRASELPENLKVIPSIHSFRLGLGREYRSERERLIKHLDEIRDAKPGLLNRLLGFVRAPATAGPRAPSKRLALGGVVVLVLVAAAIVAGLALMDRNSASPPTPGPMAANTAFPDAIESELVLAHIPGAVRTSCTRIPPIATSVFLRSVRCSGMSGGTVTYSRAHSGQALAAYFLQQAASTGVEFPTRNRTCNGMGMAADAWTRKGTQTHVEHGHGRAEGRVLCFESSSDATLMWTDTPTKIFATARLPIASAHALYNWWRVSAGPEKELRMNAPMSVMGPWPDAIEQELLLDHIPAPIRKTCRRSPPDYEDQIYLRGVTCTQTSAGGAVEYLYAHSGSALNEYISTRIGAIGLNGLGGSCAHDTTAATAWSRMHAIEHVESGRAHAEGRVLCSDDPSSGALIEWSDVPTGIYARATRPSSGRRALYAWWRSQAGPGELEDMSAMSGGETPTAPAMTNTAPTMTETTMGG